MSAEKIASNVTTISDELASKVQELRDSGHIDNVAVQSFNLLVERLTSVAHALRHHSPHIN